ncbi:MAG TPA: NAD-dependent epimerase/dehydratase family protein [Terriglobales bacterium]|nr:NAD-dependent epimerase/dehydratase family protein [Terriglobales bacterium]
MPERVLITGGAGFLGSHLADRLLQAGYQVRLLDNLDPQVHPHGRPSYLNREAELQVASVLEEHAVERALDGVSAVVHFAAVVGVGQSLYQIAHYNLVNTQGTAVLLQAILRRQRRPGSGIGRLLVAGSMSMYGEGRYWCPDCQEPRDASARSPERLLRHDWEPECPVCSQRLEPRPTDEGKAPQLASIYALNKYMQEEMCLLFGRTYRIPSVALRFFNAYGPRQALANPYTGVAAVFASELLAGRRPQIFEDGQQRRTLVSVYDVVSACALALEAAPEALAPGVFNVAGPEATTIAELATHLARALAVDLSPAITGRFRLGDARHCIADITRARNALGYAPQVGIARGMLELAHWLSAQNQPAALGQRQATAELAAYGLTG